MDSRARRGLLGAALAGTLLVIGACSGGGGDDGDGGGDRLALLEPVLSAELGTIAGNVAMPGGPPGCLTIQPIPWADGDGDEIPDTLTFIYDADGCAFDWGDATGTIYGVCALADLGAELGYATTLTGMTYVMTSGDPVATVTRVLDGTRVTWGTRQALTMEESLTIEVASTLGRAATMTTDLTATFTADAGGEIHFGPGTPFPAGHFDLAGTLIWVEDADTTVFAVTTVTPIVYEPGCLSPFPTAGVVWLQATSGPELGRLIVGWDGCGSEMTLDWEPAR